VFTGVRTFPGVAASHVTRWTTMQQLQEPRFMFDLFSEQILRKIVCNRILAESHVAHLVPIGDGTLFRLEALFENLLQIGGRLGHLQELAT